MLLLWNQCDYVKDRELLVSWRKEMNQFENEISNLVLDCVRELERNIQDLDSQQNYLEEIVKWVSTKQLLSVSKDNMKYYIVLLQSSGKIRRAWWADMIESNR